MYLCNFLVVFPALSKQLKPPAAGGGSEVHDWAIQQLHPVAGQTDSLLMGHPWASYLGKFHHDLTNGPKAIDDG